MPGHRSCWPPNSLGGIEDPRFNAVYIPDRSIAGLPPGVQKIRCRWVAGFFAGTKASACVERNVKFAIGMENTELAVIDYLPGARPKNGMISCIVRRTRSPVAWIPTTNAAPSPRTNLRWIWKGELVGYMGIPSSSPTWTWALRSN